VLFDDDTVLEESLLTALLKHEVKTMGLPLSSTPMVVRLAGFQRNETVALFREARVFLDLFLPGKERRCLMLEALLFFKVSSSFPLQHDGYTLLHGLACMIPKITCYLAISSLAEFHFVNFLPVCLCFHSGFEAQLFGALSVIADAQNGADRDDYPPRHFLRIGFEDEDFEHTFQTDDDLVSSSGRRRSNGRRGGGVSSGKGLALSKGVASRCGFVVAAVHADFLAATQRRHDLAAPADGAEAAAAASAAVAEEAVTVDHNGNVLSTGGLSSSVEQKEIGLERSLSGDVVCRHALVARRLAQILFSNGDDQPELASSESSSSAPSSSSQSGGYRRAEDDNMEEDEHRGGSAAAAAKNKRAAAHSNIDVNGAAAQALSLQVQFSGTTRAVFCGRHVQLITAVSTPPDFAWLPALLASTITTY
jgi:hypothetical protein